MGHITLLGLLFEGDKKRTTKIGLCGCDQQYYDWTWQDFFSYNDIFYFMGIGSRHDVSMEASSCHLPYELLGSKLWSLEEQLVLLMVKSPLQSLE